MVQSLHVAEWSHATLMVADGLQLVTWQTWLVRTTFHLQTLQNSNKVYTQLHTHVTFSNIMFINEGITTLLYNLLIAVNTDKNSYLKHFFKLLRNVQTCTRR